jgi:hypothetical protein
MTRKDANNGSGIVLKGFLTDSLNEKASESTLFSASDITDKIATYGGFPVYREGNKGNYTYYTKPENDRFENRFIIPDEAIPGIEEQIANGKHVVKLPFSWHDDLSAQQQLLAAATRMDVFARNEVANNTLTPTPPSEGLAGAFAKSRDNIGNQGTTTATPSRETPSLNITTQDLS